MLFGLLFNTALTCPKATLLCARLLFLFLVFSDGPCLCFLSVFLFLPGDESQTFLNTHSPCWALLWAPHGGQVSEYLLIFASHTKYFILYDLEFMRTISIFILHISSSFSLDRGSYLKGSPQIRIGRDLEENSFFWKKGSETDLWMNYPAQHDKHNLSFYSVTWYWYF